jgi:hypothetical protein
MRRTKRRARRRQRRARRTRGGGLWRMLFGGVVDKDDPETEKLRTKCLSKYAGLDYNALKMVCGTNSDNMYITPYKKGDGPISQTYFNSKEYKSKTPPHLLPKLAPVHI